MIQRIQTVYLLLALALSAALFYVPFYHFDNNQVLVSTHKLYLWVIAGISCFECLVAIFFYKQRKIQRLICRMLIVIQLVYLVAGFYFVRMNNPIDFDIHSFGLGALLPVISIVLVILALRGINKDEELIKSMDRLR